MRAIAVPGATLRIDERGAGAAALFVHGFGGSRATWDGVWAALPPDARRLVRHDLRGFGASVAEDPAAAFAHAADLAALIDALKLATVDLVGMSMGGAASLTVALDRPERVRSLVLVSPAMTGWDWSAAWRAEWRAITGAARRGDMATARDSWWANPLFDGVRDTPAAATVREEIDRFAGAQWVRDPQARALPDVDRLTALAVPTLLLTGGRDHPDFRLIGDLIGGASASVERIDLPERGHMLHIENPAWCAAQIARWWAAHPPR